VLWLAAAMSRPTPVRDSARNLSLLWRATLASAAVLTIAFILLLVTPVTVSAPIRLTEAVILTLGLAAMLAVNLILVRRALAPLRELEAQMDQVDLRNPELRLTGTAAQTGELVTFTSAFNAMLDRLAEERRAGSRAALIAQERERLRIARALHDEAGQTLTAIALEIERAATGGPPAERERMARLAAQLHSSLDDIRRLTRELRPEALDDLGLVNALIALTSRAARQASLQIERRFSGELPALSSELELVVYRVAQEALTNVLRHAQASRCVVALEPYPGGIELTVNDDGRGLPQHVPDDTIGIEGMRERALLAGGSLAIESQPGQGTLVTLRVPAGEVP
jgi:two-component system, NarL family, sensor histidine kinase UhpB